MKSASTIVAVVFGASLSAAPAFAQAQFGCGSSGADGPLNVPAGPTVFLNVPDSGILNFTSVTVSGRLEFRRNPAFNQPIVILATGDVSINSGGTLDLNGKNGTSLAGGLGGPGGFDGGAPGITGGQPGAGHGPGAGRAAIGVNAGHASYGQPGSGAGSGPVYGSPLLIPLAGGSGGGGAAGNGGGGGGGAILICSPTQIVINGTLQAIGGNGAGDGSGGAIRLLSPVVRGTGSISGYGNCCFNGHGRIRVDTIDRTGLTMSFNPQPSVGSFMSVGAATTRRLDIVRVAENDIAVGTPSPLSLLLPFNAPPSVAITVRASGFSGTVPITVAITPESGNPILVNAEIDADAPTAETIVNVDLPQNIAVRVHAWTR